MSTRLSKNISENMSFITITKQNKKKRRKRKRFLFINFILYHFLVTDHKIAVFLNILNQNDLATPQKLILNGTPDIQSTYVIRSQS